MINDNQKQFISFFITHPLSILIFGALFGIFVFRIYLRFKFRHDSAFDKKVKYILDYLTKVDTRYNYYHYTVMLHAIIERHIKTAQASTWQIGYLMKEIVSCGNYIRIYSQHVDRAVSDVVNCEGYETAKEINIDKLNKVIEVKDDKDNQNDNQKVESTEIMPF